MLELLSRFSFIKNYFSGIATIFMLHRVYPFEPNKLPPNENMKVSPEFLEEFIYEMQSKGYKFISLDKLYEILINGENVKKQVVFTLDDGYLDNYTHAYTIFKKYNVPFTIYITTSFPERTVILWWYVLEDLIVESNKIELSNGMVFSCKTLEEKTEAFMKIRQIILSLKKEKFLDKLTNLFKKYKIDWYSKTEKLCLSWEQIKTLSADELVTIGGHTKNHYALNKLKEEELIDEVIGGNKLIEEKIGKNVEHFAYPFGSRNEIGEREFKLIKRMNLKTCTTTKNGNIYTEHKNYLWCLPRIMLIENFNIKDIGKIRRKRVMTK